MRQDNYFTSNHDLSFYYEKVVDWERLVPRNDPGQGELTAADVAASWREVLSVAGEYVGREVAGRAAAVDRLGTAHSGDIAVSEPMRQNMQGLADLGLMGISLPVDFGGAGMPFTIQAGVCEMLARADSAAMVQYAFYSSPATMVVRFGSAEQKRRWVPRLASGEVIGWVAMTEPEAGSDVGNVSTTARCLPDGTWRIDGRKQFISSGNGQVGILLARAVSGSRGLDGLALFLVPRCVPDQRGGERLNYDVERAEEKICINGSPTCSMSFSGSAGEILGEPGDGWRQITSFMNEARLAVGVQATGVAQAALTAAQDYAALRVQSGKPIREHPLVAEMLLDMETTVAAMRALWTEASVAHDLAQAVERQAQNLPPADPERVRLAIRQGKLTRYLRDLTPLVKYYNAEEAIRVARTSMQVFGGYGVVKEYHVERYLRDSLILPIYEGTSQIQALMATKDLVKRALRNRRGILSPRSIVPSLCADHFPGTTGRTYLRGLRAFSAAFNWLLIDTARRIGPLGMLRIGLGRAELREDQMPAMLLQAERLTQMLAHLHACRLLAKQAQEWPERASLAQRFARRTDDLCRLRSSQIRRGETDTLDSIAAWRAA